MPSLRTKVWVVLALAAVALPAFGEGATHLEVRADDDAGRSLHLGGDWRVGDNSWLGLDGGLGQYDSSAGESVDTRSFTAYFSQRAGAMTLTPAVDYWHDDTSFTSAGAALDLSWDNDALRWTVTPRWRRVSLDALQPDGSVDSEILHAPGLGLALDIAVTPATRLSLAATAYRYDLPALNTVSSPLADELAALADLGGWRGLLRRGDLSALSDFLLNNGLTQLAALVNSVGLSALRSALRTQRYTGVTSAAPEVLQQGLIDRRLRLGLRHEFSGNVWLAGHYTVNRYAQDGSKAHDVGVNLTLPIGRAWDVDLELGRWRSDWGNTTYGSVMLTRYF